MVLRCGWEACELAQDSERNVLCINLVELGSVGVEMDVDGWRCGYRFISGCGLRWDWVFVGRMLGVDGLADEFGDGAVAICGDGFETVQGGAGEAEEDGFFEHGMYICGGGCIYKMWVK